MKKEKGSGLKLVKTRELKGRHWITTQEWTREELDTLLQTAFDLKRKHARGEAHELLKGKTLIMLFYNPSTRTRNSFEAGMFQLGGHAHFLSPQATWVRLESIKDTVEVLSRYGDAITLRYIRPELPFGEGNRILRTHAKNSHVPVINMECATYHPCQGMADLMTIKEKFNRIEGKKFLLSWAPNPEPGYTGSECNTNIMLMSKFGLDVTLAHPKDYDVAPFILEAARRNAEEAGGSFEIVNDVKEAYDGAHVVYAINWPQWKLINPITDFEKRKEIIQQDSDRNKSWMCSQELMDLAARNSIYMHAMPFVRGVEVGAEVADGPHSVIYDEAENRLHAQKGILVTTIGGL